MKTYIVTGGNSGIGKATAISLAKMQLHVVITARTEQKAESALRCIVDESQNRSVESVVGSLDSIASAKQLARTLTDRCPGMAVLINNAGVWQTKRVLNPDGLEISFMVNHLGPFILSTLLFEPLKKNRPARIINVSAGLYVKGRLDLERTPGGTDFSAIRTYMNTKLCNVLFTRAFAEEHEGSGVTINAVHPGVIRTNLGNSPGFLGALLKFAKRFWASPEEGAKPPVWLATSSDVEGANGKYFDLRVEKPFAANALDDRLSRNLWDLSTRLCGL
jgi:NAD(P)-dependent dehydrogenase (short-subunit alcohol dehydrogenase family)